MAEAQEAGRREGPAFADLLGTLVAGPAGPERVSFDFLLHRLEARAFGILALLLALPNALPGPSIPGFSALFGLPLAALGVQMALGFEQPWLPRFLARRGIARARLERLIALAQAPLRRAEPFFHPRLSGLARRRPAGLALALLALVMSLPVPLGNLPVALAIILLALGLIAEDGLAIAIGLCGGIAATAWNGLLIFAGAELVRTLVRFVF